MKEENSEECDFKWEAVIFPSEADEQSEIESDPIALDAISKGFCAKSLPYKLDALCAYSSCRQTPIVIIEDVELCHEHAKIFIEKLLDNPQNKKQNGTI